MYLTLGVSGPSCAAVVERALAVPPSLMPIPGPPEVAWRSPSGEAALLTWPAVGPVTQSRAGTIHALDDALKSRPSMTRVDPVYTATAGASLAAPMMICAVAPGCPGALADAGPPVGFITSPTATFNPSM